MNKNYNKAFEFIMKWEGFKSEDPDDSGGRTIWGISERSHPETVKRLWNLPKAEAREEAKIFYKAEYWDYIEGDILDDGVDIFLFDVVVNMGKKKVIKYVVDGHYLNGLFEMFMIRIGDYNKIAKYRNNIKYLRGWLNRVIDLWEYLK